MPDIRKRQDQGLWLEILKKVDKVMKGLPSFREGGLNRENFVDLVPLL